MWQVVCRFRQWKKFKSSLGGGCASLQAALEVNHSDGTEIKDTEGTDRDSAVIVTHLLAAFHWSQFFAVFVDVNMNQQKKTEACQFTSFTGFTYI